MALQRFLDYIAARDRVWICRRLDIARHWRAIHPFPPPVDVDSDPNGPHPGTLNAATTDEAMLDGLYEHSPWIARQAPGLRHRSPPQLQDALRRVLDEADAEAGLALIRAHRNWPAAPCSDNSLTAESTHEQDKAGSTHCSPEELRAAAAAQRRLPRAGQGRPDPLLARGTGAAAAAQRRPIWPASAFFILAVRGPRGIGLTRGQIIATFERRLDNPPDVEFREALRNIHRIVEIRLADKFGLDLTLGNDIWDWHERLSVHSDPGYAEQGQLTVTYLTDAHRACAQRISHWMRDWLRRSRDRRCGQRGRPLPRRAGRRRHADDRQPLRHSAQRRQVRRPAGHLRAHGCVRELHRQAGACPITWK